MIGIKGLSDCFMKGEMRNEKQEAGKCFALFSRVAGK